MCFIRSHLRGAPTGSFDPGVPPWVGTQGDVTLPDNDETVDLGSLWWLEVAISVLHDRITWWQLQAVLDAPGVIKPIVSPNPRRPWTSRLPAL